MEHGNKQLTEAPLMIDINDRTSLQSAVDGTEVDEGSNLTWVSGNDTTSEDTHIHRGYPAKRALSAMRNHGG